MLKSDVSKSSAGRMARDVLEAPVCKTEAGREAFKVLLATYAVLPGRTCQTLRMGTGVRGSELHVRCQGSSRVRSQGSSRVRSQ
eukprot:2482567-Rhodomonas_salina.3